MAGSREGAAAWSVIKGKAKDRHRFRGLKMDMGLPAV
jgi:hypothetical protein